MGQRAYFHLLQVLHHREPFHLRAQSRIPTFKVNIRNFRMGEKATKASSSLFVVRLVLEHSWVIYWSPRIVPTAPSAFLKGHPRMVLYGNMVSTKRYLMSISLSFTPSTYVVSRVTWTLTCTFLLGNPINMPFNTLTLLRLSCQFWKRPKTGCH